MIQRLWKPWYVRRPSQLLRRLRIGLFPPKPGYRMERTLWGLDLEVDPTKSMGRGIAGTGVHDAAVCEAIVRLTRSGDTVVDVGANVGCMSTLAALVAGRDGRVLAFEPHPELFQVLSRNARGVGGRGARIELHPLALGPRAARMNLVMPPDFQGNDGIARISLREGVGDKSISVSVHPLDELMPQGTVQLMKLDVEGYELEVLRGAAAMLAAGRIRHILFEDHRGAASSDVAKFLKAQGYRLFAMPWSVSGIRLVEVGESTFNHEWNYLATLYVDQALERFSSRGWQLFKVRV